MSVPIIPRVLCLADLMCIGCAQTPRADSHSLDNPVHQVATATTSCPVCALYSVHRANVVRLLAGESQGAGVVVNADGRILTSAHVIAGADRIIVETFEGRRYKAAALMSDEALDLALVRAEPSGVEWSPVDVGAVEAVPVGSKVFVIGHPAGLGWTVTQGIVSGLRRAGEVSGGGGEELIQTDAAISPGNSGGPLLDEHGHMMGIVRSKRVGPGIENLSFAVPMSVVSRFLERANRQSAASEASGSGGGARRVSPRGRSKP